MHILKDNSTEGLCIHVLSVSVPLFSGVLCVLIWFVSVFCLRLCDRQDADTRSFTIHTVLCKETTPFRPSCTMNYCEWSRFHFVCTGSQEWNIDMDMWSKNSKACQCLGLEDCETVLNFVLWNQLFGRNYSPLLILQMRSRPHSVSDYNCSQRAI